MNVNKVMIAGTLVRDPDLRYTASGIAVVKVSLAINSKYKEKEEVTFVNVNIWGKLAEVVNQYCTKGQSLFVEGRLQTRSWEDKVEGKKRSVLETVAEKVQFVNNKRKEQ